MFHTGLVEIAIQEIIHRKKFLLYNVSKRGGKMTATKKLIGIITILACVLFLTAVACSRKAKEEPTQPAQEIPTKQQIPEETAEKAPIEVRESWQEPQVKEESVELSLVDELNARKVLKTVYFDFDKYDLREDTIATLRENAEWLKANPSYSIMLEGHCDERGTIEYNLELGAKRATAAMNYIVSLGLKAERFKTVSYGEEKPADPGHDEAAWAMNRRVEFVIEK